ISHRGSFIDSSSDEFVSGFIGSSGYAEDKSQSGCALDQASPPANSRKYRRRDTRCARMGYPYADRSGTVLCRFTCGGPAVSAAGISLSAEESGAVEVIGEFLSEGRGPTVTCRISEQNGQVDGNDL